jgi:RNA polymerase sigma-70 factor (ECF subfamily)
MGPQRSYAEDQLLVMEAQDGDIRAMEALVRRWQKRLWRHALRLTDDPDAAWDVTQQTWLGIVKGLRRLNDPARFRAWAYRITTNQAMDWLRKNRYSIRSVAEHPEPISPEKADLGLTELLPKLDLNKRLVLSLFYLEKLTISEISAALGIPMGTVKSRLHRARQELRELWQHDIEGDIP